MRKTLFLKFILCYVLFGIFGFFLVATVISDMALSHVKKEQATSLYREATMIASTYGTQLYDGVTSLETVHTQLDVLDSYLDSTIWIMNPSGRILLDSSAPVDIENQIIIENFDSTLTAGSFYTTGTFYDSFPGEVISVLAPVTSNYTVKGYVVIHYSLDKLLQSKERILKISYLLLIMLFVLAGIFLLCFSAYVYQPLRKILTAMDAYGNGNMHYKLEMDSDDEMGYLAAGVSYMAKEMAKNEDSQKKLVANVSHDFRSPLTSMKGFLEAMLDGTIPTELYEKYIGIVLNETQRLIKLTNSLLTLNNLNTKGMILEKTVFDMNQIIRDTAASFEQVCKEKSVRLQLVLTGDVLNVYADMGKIQQVLYNLIDNAIKFSHRRSEVIIETTEKHNKIFISVKDSGIGIPKESQKQIWDRFYKTDLSRGKDKKGTGLGLSITKEIIHSHNENINVISTEGVGTEFIFTLPIWEEEE